MSLQVWLPLNGSLENKGLEQNYKIEKAISGYADHTTLISNTINGKVTPTSYKWELNGQAISINKYMNQLKKYSTYSISCWLYYTDKSSHEAMAICSSGDWNVISGKFNFALWGHNGTGYTKILVPSTVAAWNGAVITLNNPSTIQPNKWYHLCLTYDSKMFKLYINGILQENQYDCSQNSTIPSSPSDENLFIGCATYYNGMTIKGSINDFRIYNHCLSPREVKLLAQGLVAHYKLNDPYLEGTTNLLNGVWTHTNFWNASLGTYSALSTQLNGGACEVVEFNNIKCLRFQALSGEEQGRIFSTYPIKANITYTVSLDYYASSKHYNALKVELHGGDYYWTPSSCSYSTLNQWKRLSITITPTSDTTLYIFAYGNINEYAYINNIQLEEKDHATPYTPSSRNNNIAYDCSGYGNHLLQVGNIIIDNTSPRYSCAVDFNQSGYFKKDDLNLTTNQFTYSYWVKPKASTTGQHFLLGTQDDTWAPDNGLALWRDKDQQSYNWIICANNKSYIQSSISLESSQWSHIVFVYTGTEVIVYKNGNRVSLTIYGDNNTILHPRFYIGNSSYQTTLSSETEEASISDVRLYATALSAAAVKELYQSSISFLDNGILQCSEIVESPTNLKYNKNGIVQAKSIDESIHLNEIAIKTLDDGSVWGRVFYHKNNGGTTLFTSASEVLHTTSTDKFSRLDWLPYFKGHHEKYEFLLNFKEISGRDSLASKYNRWKQTNAPQDDRKADTNGSAYVDGYEAIAISWNNNYWGGLGRQNDDINTISWCCIDGSIGHGNWFYAIGAYSSHDGGTPGPSSGVAETELWVRLDTNMKFFKDAIQVSQIYEL